MLINTIENIITIEWNMFQKVNNIGGRADCQDDYETFYIMRRSQYENWSDRMIRCYYSFLCDCEANGRNLVTEKYRLINQMIPVLLQWEEEFAVAYPGLAGRGRPITSEGDASGFTSMETYARGEFETYPTELLQLYADYVENLKSTGKSMSLMIQDTMVKLYGYSSIEEAEASCRT